MDPWIGRGSYAFFLLRVVLQVCCSSRPEALEDLRLVRRGPRRVRGHPHIWSETWIGVGLEFTAETAILLGLLTQARRLHSVGRDGGRLLSVSQPNGMCPSQNHGEPPWLCSASSSFLRRARRGELKP